MSVLKSEIRLLLLNVSFAHSRPMVRSTNSEYDNSRDLLVPLSLMTIELVKELHDVKVGGDTELLGSL